MPHSMSCLLVSLSSLFCLSSPPQITVSTQTRMMTLIGVHCSRSPSACHTWTHSFNVEERGPPMTRSVHARTRCVTKWCCRCGALAVTSVNECVVCVAVSFSELVMCVLVVWCATRGDAHAHLPSTLSVVRVCERVLAHCTRCSCVLSACRVARSVDAAHHTACRFMCAAHNGCLRVCSLVLIVFVGPCTRAIAVQVVCACRCSS